MIVRNGRESSTLATLTLFLLRLRGLPSHLAVVYPPVELHRPIKAGGARRTDGARETRQLLFDEAHGWERCDEK